MNCKQCIKMLTFIFVFVFILTGLTYCLRTSGEIKDIFNGFYAEDKNTIDVIMIGSSPVFPFYSSPKIYGETGYTCYPLSSHVQRPNAALPLIMEAEKYQSPDLYVFEMRMYTMENGRMEANMTYTRGVTDNMKYSLNRIKAINRLVPNLSEQEKIALQDEDLSADMIDDRYTYYFDIFKYHSNWKSLRKPDQLSRVFGEKKSPLKGFVIKADIEALPENEREASFDDIINIASSNEKLNMPIEQEDTLRELLTYLNTNNKQALFIVSPYNVTSDEMKMYNYMKEIIEAYGFEFDNFNEHYDTVGIDFDTDYYDGGSHVNLMGAKKCTEYLELLIKEYDLTDHRGDDKYSDWNESYDYYIKKANEAVPGIE